MLDELSLLSRARALDNDALAQIHDTYHVPVFRYVSYRVNDYQLAEDLTSEVFTRLLSALRDRTAPQNSLRGWLFSVASRVVKDHYRKRYRAELSALDDAMPSGEDSPDEIIESMLTQERLHQAMNTLTEEQKDVIALRFGFGMSIQDVSETMGKSEGSVKMLQARAIAALSRKLSPTRVN